MNTTKILGIGLLITLVVAIGAYFYPKAQQQIAGASPAGTSFNTAKFAAIAINLVAPGANATSSSILNTDANDRVITSLELACEGVGSSFTLNTGAGLAKLLLTVGTTSTAAPAAVPTNNLVANAVTVATATPNLVYASSTAAGLDVGSATGLPGLNNVWKAGSYLTFWYNATNTALCTQGVKYIPL